MIIQSVVHFPHHKIKDQLADQREKKDTERERVRERERERWEEREKRERERYVILLDKLGRFKQHRPFHVCYEFSPPGYTHCLTFGEIGLLQDIMNLVCEHSCTLASAVLWSVEKEKETGKINNRAALNESFF